MDNQNKKCLSCGSDLSESFVDIGCQYPSAVYPENIDAMKDLKISTLDLGICSNSDCSLVQLMEISDLGDVFERYPYESNSTATMKGILKDVVDESSKVAKIDSQSTILDIGGNDGTMLGLFNEAKNLVNIDAAGGVNSTLDKPNYHKIVGLYSKELYGSLNLPKPDLITAVAMFYHLNDPIAFCKEVVDVMKEDSIFCIQMTYLGSMYENNIYDNIVHEHRAYYSLYSLKKVFDQVGLHIYGAKIVQSYGGSIRVYAGLDPNREISLELKESMKEIIKNEKEAKMNLPESLAMFNDRLQLLKKSTRNLIDHIVEREGPMVAFGASTKGNMICQFLGLTKEHISCVYDNSPKKIGSFLVGSNIPILDEKESENNLPKYILILPYYYLDFFKGLVTKISKGDKHYILSPLPDLNIVSIN
tara:strand:- start:4444 stop:5697 length:1254 start_codon:yes stop_codon:yes gene_type:complete